MSEIEEMKNAIAGLLATRGGKYSQPELFKIGGTRYLYEARWGPNKEREVVIKADKTPKNPRAVRHVARGCDTHNELAHVASMDNPGVVKIIDYFSPEETKKFGISGWVTVEEKFLDSRSLEEKISDDGIFSREDALSVAFQLTRTMKDVVRRVISRIWAEPNEEHPGKQKIRYWNHASEGVGTLARNMTEARADEYMRKYMVLSSA